ncbi:NADPH:quinone reductase [Streptomyces marincola]|uniref:NADPH:quinone reductase n=1 Tax=Streptomyces marincola TaxID=2878388 RepID=A0A1W7CZF8_9ACTN|nr:NADPH:quinone reductase [Streptomyces marincola]ARQ70097.1 NADPH:quinone reductase [Streptomyces marincola]
MRAIVYHQGGPSDVLRLVEREPRRPDAGEVRVRVVTSGVNPTDWKQRENGPSGGTGEETVPHLDAGGIVDAVGPGVEHLRVGDRVWTFMASAYRPGSGTAQEFTTLSADRVAPLPDGIDFGTAAAIGVPALTAHRALTVHEDGPRRLGPGALAGRTVLVSGGAGAVGHAAIQLARWAGAEVVTTVSGDAKAALATAAGASHVLKYTDPDTAGAIREIAPNGVDIVVEVAAGANAALDAEVIADRGTIAVYGNDRGDDAVRLEFGPYLYRNVRYQFLVLYTVGEQALRAGAEDVAAALRDGALPVGEEAGLPLHRYPLEETGRAHDAVAAGAVGKVLVEVTAP